MKIMNRKFIMILLAIVISSGCIAAQVPTFALTYDLYEGEEYIYESQSEDSNNIITSM